MTKSRLKPKKFNKYFAIQKRGFRTVFVGEEIFATSAKDAEEEAKKRGYVFNDIAVYIKDV